MDSAKAKQLEEQLTGEELDGWTITRLIDNGKSAAVFVGERAGQLAAIKVFDTELIERYGDDTQLARIERELELRGHSHDNVVSIYGGGHDASHNLYFVVMEYLDGPSLRKALGTVKDEQIPSLVRQLAAGAKYLENLGLVHRDIKPDNIALLDGGSRLVLLDLGVIRPVGGSHLTDPEGIQAFIGTLQYSSPEFLLREEKQDLEGYRALTYYQIGAVLHDLLTKKPIFEQFSAPYAKLVNAVQFERPVIVAPHAAPGLVQLAERCLVKNPSTRLRLVDWSDFERDFSAPGATARDRVAERLLTLRAQRDDDGATPPPHLGKQFRRNIVTAIKTAAVTARATLGGLPPLRHVGGSDGDEFIDFIFEPSPQAGMPFGLLIRTGVEIIDGTEAVIACSGCAGLPKAVEAMTAGQCTPWFEGAMDNISLHSSFEQFFFEAIEWCNQISPGVSDTFTGLFQPKTLMD